MSKRNVKWVSAFIAFILATVALGYTINGELVRARFENLTTDPSSALGRIYFNTATGLARIYDGSAWSDIGGSGAALSQYFTDVGSASNARTQVNTNLLGEVRASSAANVVTVTIASPGVFSLTSHGLATGDKFYLTTTGSLPTGLVVNTTYYAINVTANTFKGATTRGNALDDVGINTSGSQSGVHTVFSGGLRLDGFYEEWAGVSTASNGAITTSAILKVTRIGRHVTVHVPSITGSPCVAATNVTFGEMLPLRFRPPVEMDLEVAVVNNGSVSASPALLAVGVGGSVSFYSHNGAVVNFTAGGTCGLAHSMWNISYYTNN